MPEMTRRHVAPTGRLDPESRAAMLKLVDLLGLYLICPERGCRRRRGCADPDEGQFPFCFWQHRGTVRFFLAQQAALAGVPVGRPAGSFDELDDDEPPAPTASLVPPNETVLGRLRAAGVRIHRLARARDDAPDETTWEQNPAACALVESLRRPKSP